MRLGLRIDHGHHGAAADPAPELLKNQLLGDHAQNLIDRLQQWSLALDKREQMLVQREQEVERGLRQLRMQAAKRRAPSLH